MKANRVAAACLTTCMRSSWRQLPPRALTPGRCARKWLCGSLTQQKPLAVSRIHIFSILLLAIIFDDLATSCGVHDELLSFVGNWKPPGSPPPEDRQGRRQRPTVPLSIFHGAPRSSMCILSPRALVVQQCLSGPKRQVSKVLRSGPKD